MVHISLGTNWVFFFLSEWKNKQEQSPLPFLPHLKFKIKELQGIFVGWFFFFSFEVLLFMHALSKNVLEVLILNINWMM